MAGHLPIGTGMYPKQMLDLFGLTKEKIESEELFKRNYIDELEVHYQVLPVNEYCMDEEHGKVDKYVIYFYKLDENDYSYEVHYDKNLKVNQVYLVM
tara:strand:+ start:618 stop:908 length:291 start_codon:yes stop_codon:yes gene_type:complete